VGEKGEEGKKKKQERGDIRGAKWGKSRGKAVKKTERRRGRGGPSQETPGGTDKANKERPGRKATKSGLDEGRLNRVGRRLKGKRNANDRGKNVRGERGGKTGESFTAGLAGDTQG